jgi:hypothetical protein
MTRSVALLWACLFAATHATAAETTRFAKPLTLPAFEGEELVAVPLDSDVFARSEINYPDLRIVDAENNEVAYVIRRAQQNRSRKVQSVWSAEKLALKPLEDGGLEITFQSDLQRHPRAPQGIRFYSPLVNFDHHVKVETSTDGENWKTLVDDGLIFDYSQFMDVRNLAVELPHDSIEQMEDKPTHYRLTFDDVTQEQQSQLLQLSRNLQGDEETNRTERTVINRQPFRIDRIELWIDEIRKDVAADREEAYPVVIDGIEQDPENKQTFVIVKSRREPLTEIAIVTPARNFTRNARLEMPVERGDAKTWQHVGSTNFSRIDFRTLQRESLDLSFPETRASEYRLVIENHDSPPLEIDEVTARGHVYEAVFLANKGANYTLTYGSDLVPPPNYDTAAISASLGEGFTPLVATLGVETSSDLPVPTTPFITSLLRNTWLMTAVIGVLVLVLAAALYRATQHLDEMKDT